MSTINVRHEDQPQGGRYVVTLPGSPDEAELVWERVSPGVIAAVHTFAPPSMRGSGASLAMVERLVADMRAAGLQIQPRCSYVRLQFERHPEWQSLLAAA